MPDVAVRVELAQPRVDLRLTFVFEAVSLRLVAVGDPILARLAVDDQILHERDVQTAVVERDVVERHFASPILVADGRDVSVPVELNVLVAVGLTGAVFVPILAWPNFPADDSEDAALDGWVRGGELSEDALGDGRRRQLVSVFRGVVSALELRRAQVLALVFGLVCSRVRRHRLHRGIGRNAARDSEQSGACERGRDDRLHASPSTITGCCNRLPSSMTASPSSLKRPVKNQSTARGKITCSPAWTRATRDSIGSPGRTAIRY